MGNETLFFFSLSLSLEHAFNEKLSDRMKTGVSYLLNVVWLPRDFQNFSIQKADKLDNFKITKQRVLSNMEAKSALNPNAMDTDNVDKLCDGNTDQDCGEEEDIGDCARPI